MSDEETRKTAISVFAGEVVLGTANRAERSIVEERLAADPLFQAEIRAWERRLAPLGAVVPPAAPSAGLWDRIAAETVDRVVPEPEPVAAPPEDNESGPVVSLASASALAARARLLERRLNRWRIATGAATALAASIAAVAVLRPELVPTLAPPSGHYVGVVNASGDTPPLVVSIDMARGEISLRPLGLAKAEGKDYELWAVPDGAKPVSLGLVAEGGRRAVSAGARDTLGNRDLTIAVSVEPTGGSPTGQPTGPVILTGKLVRND